MPDLSSEALHTFARNAQAPIAAETMVVALAEGDEEIAFAVAVGKHAAAIEGKRGMVATSGLCGTAFTYKKPELVCKTQGDWRVRQDHAEALGITTAIAVPILRANRVLGAFMALNRMDGKAFGERDRDVLTAYVRDIATHF